ncbi:NlpC/P60 family protein [Geodermatophilus ruber]|uniref:Cell wall-associated hydrolase, NlpC family n=1 Tax=Geodermatophilus ruber TaxID=504800 RepID=A0A1I4BLN0_9ACTN|nr:NlpC/P60 family protein [Geodermatophilus ruber]SFK68876.1 Cell wall-associated hydrolase, NlpC family [Geodermatophilus ruber]
MAVLSAVEIYRYARMAGFSPDQAVTMTAVALAESGGEAGAHNPRGEDSRGLWQINVAAHRNLGGQNLYDPLVNAQAAYRVSQGGKDISPWTTTHRGTSARYVAYRAEAESAARAAGDNATGVWTGTPGYGSPLAAGNGGGPALAADMPATGPATGGGATEQFVQAALAQKGDSYVFGAEADPTDPDPTTFDCSELTQWAAAQVGVELPDGSWHQYLDLQEQGGALSVEQALHTRGALLFYFSAPPSASGGRPSQAHVAISQGDGRTIEAMNPQRGVLESTADTKRFNYAAVIPELATATAPAALPAGPAAAPALPPGPVAAPAAPMTFPAVDTDRDGLVDAMELLLGTDPLKTDTDADGVSDGYEKYSLGTDPTRADSDGDGTSDAAELVRGTDPIRADSDGDGRVDGGDTSADTDQDGLSDMLEKILGTRPDSIDSDADGVTDQLEYRSGMNPLDPVNAALPTPTSGSGGLASGPLGQDADPLGQPSPATWQPDPVTGY